MLNLFLTGRGNVFFILPLILLVFMLKSMITPELVLDSPSFLFTKIDAVFYEYKYLKLFLGFFFIISLSFYIKSVFNAHDYYQIESALPSLLFVILIGAWSGFHFFSPLYISLLFILLGLNQILFVYHQKNIIAEVFNAGFFLGLAAIIYYPAVLFILSFWLFISMNRAFNFREYLFPTMGLALPFFFLGVYFFYFDLPYDFIYISNFEEVPSLISIASITQRIFLVLNGIAIIVALPFFIKQISRAKVKAKNNRRMILILFLNSMLIYYLSFDFFPIHNRELLLVIPMVFIIPFYFYNVSSLFQNLLFYFWIVAALLFDFIPVL